MVGRQVLGAGRSMSTSKRAGWRGAVCACGLISAAALADQPHALQPLPTPYFTIDLASPSIGGVNNLHADDILQKPGPMVAIPNTGMNLGRPGDELDGLSGSRSDVPTTQPFAILFSVDRATVGSVGPDPAIVAMGYPYNVQQQAGLGQAAGDLFMTTGVFDRSGPIAGFRALGNNTKVINQGDAGGIDFQLDPDISPDDPAVPPIDELDGVAYFPPVSFRTAPASLYFSVSNTSPSLAFLPPAPGGASGASIFFDANPMLGGGEVLYAFGNAMGLLPGDDIDAMIVFDQDTNGVFVPGVDQIIFSLSRNSPTVVNLGFSAADLFTWNGLGPRTVFAHAADLGLLASDDVDALELLVTNDITQSIHDHAIFRTAPACATCAGDVSGNNRVDGADIEAFVGCLVNGPGPVPGCGCADLDNDASTTVLDIGPFVTKLLGAVDTNPACP